MCEDSVKNHNQNQDKGRQARAGEASHVGLFGKRSVALVGPVCGELLAMTFAISNKLPAINDTRSAHAPMRIE